MAACQNRLTRCHISKSVGDAFSSMDSRSSGMSNTPPKEDLDVAADCFVVGAANSS